MSIKHSRVLIVIPTIGQRLDLLRQTLQSLVNQKPEKPDIVVVCPKKKIEIRKLAREFGAMLADDPGSLSSALNAGFALAKPWHEYGSWMGDDDLLRPGSLAITTSALDSNLQAVAAFGYCDYIDDKGKTLFTSRAGRHAPWLMRWGPNLVPLPGILYRLSAARKAGSYDNSLKYAMDLDMWLRLRKEGEFLNTRKTLGAFRWHPSSTTVANRRASLQEAEMIKRRYMPKYIRAVAPIWEGPVRFATHLAVRRVNSLGED